MTCVLSFVRFPQPDLQLAMDYVNNASNSYGSGDTVSSSLAAMSIHQENGVQMGHRNPADAKMKGQSGSPPHPFRGFQPPVPAVRFRC